jgi:hypothetical protein
MMAIMRMRMMMMMMMLMAAMPVIMMTVVCIKEINMPDALILSSQLYI